jgi:hypothetical protein
MPRLQHEIPTHLNVEDKVLLGLTVRQLLYLMVGCSLGYGCWGQTSALAVGLRVALAAGCVLLAALFALVRPLDRSLEEWVVAAVCYLAAARTATWQPPAARAADWAPPAGDWQELTPALDWTRD